MPYIGTQPNDVKQNTGLYTPNEILQLEKDGNWGGSLELIESQTVTGVSVIDFLEIKENVYDVHLMKVSATGGNNASSTGTSVRLYENGVLESASVYKYAFRRAGQGATDVQNTGTSQIGTITETFNSTDASGGQMYFYNLGNASRYSMSYKQSNNQIHANWRAEFGSGVLPQASKVDGIRLFSSITYDNVTATLYGIKQI